MNQILSILKNCQKTNVLIIVFLFLSSFLIRFFLTDFPHLIVFYPDELNYYQIAQNLSRGKFLIVNNESVGFQKILYSLFLTPIFYFFKNPEMQTHCFSALNAFLVSSVIFPAFLIGKLCLKNQKTILLLCFLSLLLSDLSYSLTFMSENLFLPLGVWGIYFIFKIIISNRTHFLFSLFLGFFIYLIYFTKEIGIVLLLSFYFYILVSYFLKQNIHLKEQFKNACLISFSFLLFFVFFKLTFFKGLSNSYSHQIGLDILQKQENLFFMFYGFFYYLMNVTVAGLFFIFAIPFVYFKNLNSNAQKLFLFCIFIIILSAAVVAFTITVREDFSREFPRAHLRYLAYIWIPLLTVFLSFFEKIKEYNNNNNNNLKNNFNFTITFKQKTILFFFAFLIILFYLGANPVGDHIMLAFVRSKEKLFVFKILLFISFVLFCFNFKNKNFNQKTIYFLNIFLFVFAVVNFSNNRHAYRHFKPFYEVKSEEKLQIEKMQNFILQNKNKTFLIADELGNRSLRAADTFLNYENIKTIHLNPSFLNDKNILKNVDYIILNIQNKKTDFLLQNNFILKQNLNSTLWQVFQKN